MATTVEEAISRSVQTLQERRVGLAEAVIEGDKKIDEQENRIEEECLKLLALHQPVAIDLRRIAAILKINNDLERMADLAVNIGESGLRLAELSPLEARRIAN